MVTATIDRVHRRSLHPLHAVFLAGAVPLFLGVLLADIAYASSYQVQWKNFAAWLIIGALVFGGLALLWGLFGLLRADGRGKRQVLYVVLLLAAWVVGFVNALAHAMDVWESMPAGLVFSAIGAVLAIAATAVGFSNLRPGRLA